MVIGIAGGVASGKSAVAKMLAGAGGVAIDGDVIGHQVLEDDEVRSAMEARWDNDVFGDDGVVLRQEVARRVFALTRQGRQDLVFLEALTHPRIGGRIRRRIDEAERSGATMVVLDAAVMFKTGWDQVCDQIIFVEVPIDTRRERALNRGWTAEQFAQREKSQMDLNKKRQAADFVVDNGGSWERTREQVDRIVNTLTNESS